MYNKLFTGILDSTIWLEDNATRIVWITFLAAMDDDGFVRFGSIKNVANRAHVTVDEAENAIKCLSSPDSQAPEQESQGRRIERVDGGFYVLNFAKYRDLFKREDERVRNRARKQNQRAREKAKSGDVTPCHDLSQKVPKSTSSDTDTDTKNREYVPEKKPLLSPPETEGESKEFTGEAGTTIDRPSLTDVLGYCSIHLQAPRDWVEKWWLEVDAAGWLDYRSRPVTNWKSYFTGQVRHWEQTGKPQLEIKKDAGTEPKGVGDKAATGPKDKKTGENRRPGAIAYALKSKKEAALESLKTIDDRASHDAFGAKLTPELKAEKKRLKLMIADINRRLLEL